MLTVEDIIEMRKVVASAQLLTSGAFKKELDEIAAAQKELDDTIGKQMTVAAAEKTRKDAEVILAAAKAAMKKQQEDGAKQIAELAQQRVTLAAREKALGELEEAAKQRANEAALAERQRKQTATDQEAAYAKRVQDLDKRAASLQAAEEEVVRQRADLADRASRIRQAVQ